MSVRAQVDRVKAKVATIRNKFVSLGIAKSTDNIDALATAVESIPKRTSASLTVDGLKVTAPAGYYHSKASKTLTDGNLNASNIKKDVSIFGVTGEYEGEKPPIYNGTDMDAGVYDNDDDYAYIQSTVDPHNVGSIIEDVVYSKVTLSDFGNATAADVRAGARLTSAEGFNIEGEMPTVGVGAPNVTTLADDEEGEIYISATTTQQKGYCEGGKSATVGKYIKLKIEGDTAIMYVMADPSQEVRRKVGASINTCTVNVTFTTNAGNTLISATTFANGAFSVFTSRTKTGTVTIPNVVCGSAVSIATSTMCSLYWSGSVVNHQSGYGGTITVPTTANATHTVEVGVLDD